MNPFLLYLLLLRATLTTFSGLASLPVLRQDLVVDHQVLTDVQLNAAIVIGRTTPGPAGLYLVSAGYLVAGWPGAFAGWLAMCTPAFLIIPLLVFVGRRAEHPRAISMMQAIVFAGTGLLWSSAVPFASAIAGDPVAVVLAVISVTVLVRTRAEILWVVLGSAVASLAVAAVRATLNC